MAKKIKKLILNGEAYDLSTPSATSSVAWAVKLGSDTEQTTAANAVSSNANRTYAIQTNSSWQMVVNVPWTDTETSAATSSVAGTVKLGSDTPQSTAANAVSSTSNRSYAIQLNGSWQMVVNVPWENTTYTNVSSFTNDAWYITNAVNDLANYYKKSETYTQAEVNALVQNFQWFEIVATLPTSDIKTNVIYLLWPTWTGADKYEEYVYASSTWVKIGDTSVDLTNYVTLNSAQTISGTKTFSAEPVLPTKSTAATNSWTKPATEAQVYTVAQAVSTLDWAVVKTTWNQTIAWTKTFSTSPVVPSKTSDATNSWTAIATEAQVYKKLDSSSLWNATITFKQGISSTAIGTLTTNQSSNGTITMHDNVPITQADYDDLPSSKATDWNAYWIYETTS